MGVGSQCSTPVKSVKTGGSLWTTGLGLRGVDGRSGGGVGGGGQVAHPPNHSLHGPLPLSQHPPALVGTGHPADASIHPFPSCRALSRRPALARAFLRRPRGGAVAGCPEHLQKPGGWRPSRAALHPHHDSVWTLSPCLQHTWGPGKARNISAGAAPSPKAALPRLNPGTGGGASLGSRSFVRHTAPAPLPGEGLLPSLLPAGSGNTGGGGAGCAS